MLPHHCYPQTFYKEERCHHHQKNDEFIWKHGKPVVCRKHRAGQVIRLPALVPVTIKPMPSSADTLHLYERGDYVLELAPTVSPHWLGEFLKCL